MFRARTSLLGRRASRARLLHPCSIPFCTRVQHLISSPNTTTTTHSQHHLHSSATAASPPPGNGGSSEGLFHRSFNSHQPRTILLLHGLLSSHREWTYVTPHLSSYHVLVADLPSHSSSAHITPFTIPNAVSNVASLLESQAHQPPRCHVVGLSAGGYVALALAKARPDLVESLFVTGVGGFAGRSWLMAAAPYLVFGGVKLQSWLPVAVNEYMVRQMGMQLPDGLQDEIYRNLNFAMVKQAYASILDYGDGEPLPMRTLVVAGGRQDDVEGTKKLGHVLRIGCDQSRAVVVDGAVHAWNLQWPELFAKGVSAWIEAAKLPAAFKELR